MGELVKIAEFDSINEAYIIKSRLESEGIPVYLINETLNSLFPTGGFTSVILQVPLEESIRAMDILYEEPPED